MGEVIHVTFKREEPPSDELERMLAIQFSKHLQSAGYDSNVTAAVSKVLASNTATKVHDFKAKLSVSININVQLSSDASARDIADAVNSQWELAMKKALTEVGDAGTLEIVSAASQVCLIMANSDQFA